jgi:hypothetical protein
MNPWAKLLKNPTLALCEKIPIGIMGRELTNASIKTKAQRPSTPMTSGTMVEADFQGFKTPPPVSPTRSETAEPTKTNIPSQSILQKRSLKEAVSSSR